MSRVPKFSLTWETKQKTWPRRSETLLRCLWKRKVRAEPWVPVVLLIRILSHQRALGLESHTWAGHIGLSTTNSRHGRDLDLTGGGVEGNLNPCLLQRVEPEMHPLPAVFKKAFARLQLRHNQSGSGKGSGEDRGNQWGQRRLQRGNSRGGNSTHPQFFIDAD